MMTIQHCPNCQKLLPVDATSCPSCAQDVCPICRAALAADAERCQACGSAFTLSCSHCGAEVTGAATVCAGCGSTLDDGETTAVLRPDDDDETYTGSCPTCAEPMFIEDGFCALCGTVVCGHCGHAVAEDDEECPQCHRKLYFDCPGCRFELSAGTHICPNCSLLFPRFCSTCGHNLEPDASHCGECQNEVKLLKRRSARVIHRLQVGAGVVEFVACLDCGTQFNPAIGACPNCTFRSCPRCQIGLKMDEAFCPNCGLDFCPTCGAIVLEEASACPRCGTEFDFSCPQCAAPVAATAEACPNCGQLF